MSSECVGVSSEWVGVSVCVSSGCEFRVGECVCVQWV